MKKTLKSIAKAIITTTAAALMMTAAVSAADVAGLENAIDNGIDGLTLLSISANIM